MKFLWPDLLFTALMLPMLVVAYVWLLHRRKKMAVRLSSIAVVRSALANSPGWRRHVPPVVMLLALAALVLAVARPTASITLPTQQQTIILAMDVSGSMQAA